MESLVNTPLIEFNPNTLQNVRKEFNLDKQGRMEEAIDILEEWVKKQNHFMKKDFSRDYLERTLISTKGLVERAKVRLDRYCTFKTLLPQFFIEKDIEMKFKLLKNFINHAHIPKMTTDDYRVYFFKIIQSENLDSSIIIDYYKYVLVLSEYFKQNDYCNGYVLVMDYTDVGIASLVTKINPIELRHALTILMEGYGMRIKGMHFLTPSKMIDALLSIVKSVLSEKLSKRIHVHETVDSLYEHVPRDILPIEYGGKERPLKELQEDWFKLTTTKEYEAFLHEVHRAKTNESLRQTGKYNEDYIGMPGSFRSLNVD